MSSSFALTDAAFTATAIAQAPNCEPVVVRVTNTGGFTLPMEYTVTNNGTGQVIGPVTGQPAIFDITPDLMLVFIQSPLRMRVAVFLQSIIL